MMVSIFQHPFYPYSGVEGRSERMLNVPMAAHSGSREFREAVDGIWMPALRDFEPRVLLVSAGFDAHRDDDMAMLNFTEDDYAWVTRRIVEQARRSAAGRVISTLEGGYRWSGRDRTFRETESTSENAFLLSANYRPNDWLLARAGYERGDRSYDGLDIELSDRDEDTIGGVVLSELGRTPAVGDKVELGPVLLEVLDVDNNRIKDLRLTLLKPATVPPQEE